jgi:hypothetical protein
VKALKIILAFSLLLTFSMASGQDSFQKNRRAFQKERYKRSSKKYGKACTIFEKRQIKGEKKPLIRLGIFRRKSSKKVAEQG